MQTEAGNLNVLGALNVNFGSGDDTLNVGSAFVAGTGGGSNTPAGVVKTTGTFGVTGTGGAKTVTVVSALFGGMTWALKGTDSIANTDAETALFTDTNVTGLASINNTVTGNTSFTIQISDTNAALLNNWGSLSITNGTGSDVNNVTDTDFSGSVTINNGAGAAGNNGVGGGSETTFSDDTNNPPLNPNLLTIAGSLTITTTTGNSSTEVQDYNVHGNVTLGAGAGVAGNASIIGLEDSEPSTRPRPAAADPEPLPALRSSAAASTSPAIPSSTPP